MVIRVPEFKGVLYSKGQVIIPCHTIYNRRNNILTEIIPYGFTLKSRQTLSKMHKKVSSSKTPKNDQFTFIGKPEFSNEDELINLKAKNDKFIEDKPHFVELNDDKVSFCGCCKDAGGTGGTDSENELWNRRLNRWWGWNLQKKLQEHLNKCGYQSGDVHTPSKQEDIFNEQANKTIEKHLNPKINTSDITCPNLKESHTIFRPSSGFNKKYRGRLKRNKNNEYEGLLQEVKDNKNEKPIKYLYLRLQNVHSDHFPVEKKTYSRKKKNMQNENVDLRTIPEVSAQQSSDSNNIDNVSKKSMSSKTSVTNQPNIISICSNDLIPHKSANVPDHESISKIPVSKTVSKTNEPLITSVVQDSTQNQLKTAPEISVLEPSKTESIGKCISLESCDCKMKNPTSCKITEIKSAITQIVKETDSNIGEDVVDEFDWQKNYISLKEEHNELLMAINDILSVDNSEFQENDLKLQN